MLISHIINGIIQIGMIFSLFGFTTQQNFETSPHVFPSNALKTENSVYVSYIVRAKVSDNAISKFREQTKNLNSAIDDLMNQVTKASSIRKLNQIENNFKELYKELNECLKDVYSLKDSDELEWRDQTAKLNSRIFFLQNSLWKKRKPLEDALEELNYSYVIQLIQGGYSGNFSQAFSKLDYPNYVIKDVVRDAFEGDVNQCQNILNFTESLTSPEVIAYALLTLFHQVANSSLGIFSPEGSACVFQLAWRADQLGKWVNPEESKAISHLSKLKNKLPISVSLFVSGEAFKLLMDEKGNFSDHVDDFEEINNESKQTKCIESKKQWKAESLENGEFYLIQNLSRNKTLTINLENIAEANINGIRVLTQSEQWKPILISVDKIHLVNRESGKYLSYRDVGICYEYTLSSTSNPFGWFVLKA